MNLIKGEWPRLFKAIQRECTSPSGASTDVVRAPLADPKTFPYQVLRPLRRRQCAIDVGISQEGRLSRFCVADNLLQQT